MRRMAFPEKMVRQTSTETWGPVSYTHLDVYKRQVVRFAAQLGYDGYPEMQKALQELIRGKLTSIQRIQVSRCV